MPWTELLHKEVGGGVQACHSRCCCHGSGLNWPALIHGLLCITSHPVDNDDEQEVKTNEEKKIKIKAAEHMTPGSSPRHLLHHGRRARLVVLLTSTLRPTSWKKKKETLHNAAFMKSL